MNRVRLAGAASAWLAKLVGKPAMAAFRRNVSAQTAAGEWPRRDRACRSGRAAHLAEPPSRRKAEIPDAETVAGAPRRGGATASFDRNPLALI